MGLRAAELGHSAPSIYGSFGFTIGGPWERPGRSEYDTGASEFHLWTDSTGGSPRKPLPPHSAHRTNSLAKHGLQRPSGGCFVFLERRHSSLVTTATKHIFLRKFKNEKFVPMAKMSHSLGGALCLGYKSTPDSWAQQEEGCLDEGIRGLPSWC